VYSILSVADYVSMCWWFMGASGEAVLSARQAGDGPIRAVRLSPVLLPQRDTSESPYGCTKLSAIICAKRSGVRMPPRHVDKGATNEALSQCPRFLCLPVPLSDISWRISCGHTPTRPRWSTIPSCRCRYRHIHHIQRVHTYR
jgi:hypothetical protein